MRLTALLERAGHETAVPSPDVRVTGFAIDHRKVAPGTVFGAFPGSRFNGEAFIDAAIAAGAVAVVARPSVRVEGAVHIAADEPRALFATLAAAFFRPVPDTIVAVTGTNGKTSTVEMTRQLWRMAGHRAASIGTLGVTTPDGSLSTGLTTPDIVTFLANMAGLAREGVTHVAFEASSHGLAQHRSEGVALSAAAFTNFSRDHLDYHGTMEDYFAAKLRLFTELLPAGAPAVVWHDGSAWNTRVADAVRRRGGQVFSVGGHADADLRLVTHATSQLGQQLVVECAGERQTLSLPLIGAYQAANALVAAGLAIVTGVPVRHAFDGLARLQPVRGRLERAAISRRGTPIYIDYAHAPEAITAALDALRPHVGGRLLIVFGAGGDRDQGKRAEMGAAAAAADVVIVTDDNPRGEDPAAIRAAVLAGIPRQDGGPEVIERGDRREAIAAAVAMAGPKDIVLIAGKGHEQGQIVGRDEHVRVLPFDDVLVARDCAAQGDMT
ncbi:UDP-N-acetylmuramoyl-L-alanyl-D-glutamate--2,6-diaminopimelate ligase [Erythrobacteraceae bacterium CFH 75059]|uniref:UDP-N-acetylmuramoyl-L-alanyl-D-glutamate--2, 6-diaminopimelate ligase n=1 Tax=Qipengyuania thermophila TaxID=2509361 RepID=UPI00101F8515|nr:UDP-N-acetylmuramoyl-L-alanyl-D-glutamate--2,6-diaminopimelate ligase [Qipengyuania thermophila]TCD06183.1 UDP-N-acetylmuramoyl-L-alanyl-D-glutamate--2,6-diaminopimelate ligase [Erythrobacteraceae bacterium CFH 75059]